MFCEKTCSIDVEVYGSEAKTLLLEYFRIHAKESIMVIYTPSASTYQNKMRQVFESADFVERLAAGEGRHLNRTVSSEINKCS
jgi:hypothetical protein